MKPKVVKIKWEHVCNVTVEPATGQPLQKSFGRWFKLEPITDKDLLKHLEKEYERQEEERIIKNQCWNCKNHKYVEAWGYDDFGHTWQCKHGLSNLECRCPKRNIP
jgi:poly(3-hydroxybutyrate) depolymerase